MSEMVERVADILLNAGCGTSNECDSIARAAIEAMREPTEAMLCAVTFEDDDADIWRAMIDAALEKKSVDTDLKTC